MSTTLRAVFRPVLDELGLPETEFGEVERACRMEGLLEAGRTGPGGGTPATMRTVTMMVIALLAGITKRDGARLAPFYAEARFRDADQENKAELAAALGHPPQTKPIAATCSVTGAATFGKGLEWLLGNPFRAAQIAEVSIIHTLRVAQISWTPVPSYPRAKGGEAPPSLTSIFGGAGEEEILRVTTTTIRNPFFSHLASRMVDLGV